MNVTDEGLKAYLEKFHATLEATASRYLLPSAASSLFHLSFRPSGIRGYVSTQFGVAFEYVASIAGIEMIKGSRRIEGLFLGLPLRFERQFAGRAPAIRLRDGVMRATMNRVSINGEPFPFRLDGSGTNLTIVDCHFEAFEWSRDVAGVENWQRS